MSDTMKDGDVYTNKRGDEFVIVNCKGFNGVKIKFTTTGYETITHRSHIKSGHIRDRLKPSLYGVGVVGAELTTINGVRERSYFLWKDMFTRCYSTSNKNLNSYKDCKVHKDFIHYPDFKEWCHSQIGFGLKDHNNISFNLDKDILVKGNKLYSKDTCVFVPKEINLLLVKSNARRGTHPIGVSYVKSRNKYRAGMNTKDEHSFIGYFDTPEDAFRAYKKVKESRIQNLANKWKDQIDPRAYEALMNYQVEITD